MLECEGGAGEASRTRVRCAWGKFNQMKPILARRGASLKVKGKIYRSCVQSVLVYGSETWQIKGEDERRLERMERAMVRRKCRVRLVERIGSEILSCLGIESVLDI